MRQILLSSIVLRCLDEQSGGCLLLLWFLLGLRWTSFHNTNTRMVSAPFFSHTGNVQQRLSWLELLRSLYEVAFHNRCFILINLGYQS